MSVCVCVERMAGAKSITSSDACSLSLYFLCLRKVKTVGEGRKESGMTSVTQTWENCMGPFYVRISAKIGFSGDLHRIQDHFWKLSLFYCIRSLAGGC